MKKIFFSVIILALFACNNKKVGGKSDAGQDSITSSVKSDDNDATASEGKEDYEYYEETELFKGGYSCKSEDGCVTIKAGLHPGGGTAPDYWAVWTITNSKGKKVELKFADSPYIEAVHSLQKNDGTKYYIVACGAKASSADAYGWLEAYIITGDTIKQVNVLDGSAKVKENAFEINYCSPDWYYIANKEGFDWLFEYDHKNKNLYVPLMDGTAILDRYEVWHFNGNKFENHGEQPHKGLHKSLGKYNRLVRLFTTKDYIIRVDSLDSHELRYASWKKPKTIKDSPDLVIYGGKRKQHVVADPHDFTKCDDYRFTNDGYQYIVNYCEITRIKPGVGEDHDFLVVKKGEKVLIKQESIDE